MENLTPSERDALRTAIPTRCAELTRAIAKERDPEFLAIMRAERDALLSALPKLAT
jgi:hypothetical protein